ncbi:fungal hydrophobin-domain-containing protein [Infundibulicybe gibba]|nr:fungal hydrophobin-domain-containing protein [Infundibulicybe gibba]
MISRVASAFFLVLVAFTIFAAATTTTVTVTATPPPPTATPAPASQCNTGPVQCCNSIQSASNPVVGLLTGLLGILIEPITAIVGLSCSPIDILGIGGNSCNAQAVCCENNSFNGLIALGCSPVNLNL